MSSPDPPAETQPETSGRGLEQKANGNATEGTTTGVDNVGAKKMRVLAVYCVNDEDEDDKGFDPPDASNVLHLAARPDVEVSSKQQLITTAGREASSLVGWVLLTRRNILYAHRLRS